MYGLGLIVTGPWPQFTVTFALTWALTRATAGFARSKASWTERAEEGEGMAARPALAASIKAHRTFDARALIGSAPDILAPLAGRRPRAVALRRRIQMRISNLNSTDLFACKWLRAPVTKQDEGLADTEAANPFCLPSNDPGIGWLAASGPRPSVQAVFRCDRRCDRSPRIEPARTHHRGPGHPTC